MSLSRDDIDRLQFAAEYCEAGARFIRYYGANPSALRDWAARIESGLAPNAVSLPALALDRAANDLRQLMREIEPA